MDNGMAAIEPTLGAGPWVVKRNKRNGPTRRLARSVVAEHHRAVKGVEDGERGTHAGP